MDDRLKPIATVIGLMVALFGLLEIFVPADLVPPLGALVIGLILTAYLVLIGRWTWGTALPTWLAGGIGLIFVYLIVSRPATVVGSIIDGNGIPVVGKTLVLTDSSGVDHRTVTDEEGMFEINNVPDGKYTISADGDLLISGRVRSGWLRILYPKVETGEVVYRIAQPVSVTATPIAAIVSATDTPVSTIASTDMPMLIPVSGPIACNHPVVTKNLFPRLERVEGQSPTYGPIGEDPMARYFLCEAVYDPVHTPGGLAVHIKYENAGENFGWWGIAIDGPAGYDASQYSQLCFWAYAQQPNQSFRVKMKDKVPNEEGDIATIETPNLWEQICTPLSWFADKGIQLDKMDNVNLGFEQPTGSAEIWVADFEFVD